MGTVASNDATGGDDDDEAIAEHSQLSNRVMADEDPEEAMRPGLKGYGSLSTSSDAADDNLPENLAADRAQASEGPLPVPRRSMFVAELLGTFLLVQLGIAANAVHLYILLQSSNSSSILYGMVHEYGFEAGGGGGSSHHHSRQHESDLFFNQSFSETLEAASNTNNISNSDFIMLAVASLPVATAFVWGGALAIAMLTSAALSGGHVNPAVSLTFALVRPADFRLQTKLAVYWAAQVLGAALAAMVTLFLFHDAIYSFEQDYHIQRGGAEDEAGLTSAAAFNDYYSLHSTRLITNNIHAGCIEGFGTGVLCFTLFVLTHPKIPISGTIVPLLMGLVYSMLVYALGPLTGGAFNPAREVGPRIVTWLVGGWGWRVSFQEMWPYVVGPLIGGPAGGFLADHFLLLIV